MNWLEFLESFEMRTEYHWTKLQFGPQIVHDERNSTYRSRKTPAPTTPASPTPPSPSSASAGAGSPSQQPLSSAPSRSSSSPSSRQSGPESQPGKEAPSRFFFVGDNNDVDCNTNEVMNRSERLASDVKGTRVLLDEEGGRWAFRGEGKDMEDRSDTEIREMTKLSSHFQAPSLPPLDFVR